MAFDGCSDFFAENVTQGFIVLTKNQQYKIKTGRVIEVHFHGTQFPNRTLFCLISDKKNVVTHGSKLGKELIRAGSICPIVIAKEQMIKLETGETPAIERKLETDPPFTITVVTHDVYKKVLEARRQKEEV